MKTKRMILPLLALLIAVLALSACSASNSGPSNSKPAGNTNNGASEAAEKDTVSIPDGAVVIEGADLSEYAEKMQQAILGRSKTVCVLDYIPFTWDDLYAMDHGSFWLENYSISGIMTGTIGGKERRYQLYEFNYYPLSDAQIDQMKAEMDAAAAEISAAVPKGADIWTKARIVHDQLICRISYDQSLAQPHCHDAYGALVNGQAVCSGYASAFTLVMELLGEHCPMVVSETHAWNRVLARTYEEYIDVTWDDLDLKDSRGTDYVHYTYFGLTREEVEAADAHLIKGGSTAITDYVADPIVFNYCRHEGYRLASCDEGRASSVLRSQVKAGKNLLMLQFENAADYAQAAAWWDGDAQTANRVLWDAGLSGAYVYWLNEDMKTIMIGLDPGQ